MKIVDHDNRDLVSHRLAHAAHYFGVGVRIAFGDHGSVQKQQNAVELGSALQPVDQLAG